MNDQQKQQASIVPQWRRDALRKALEEGPRNEAGDPCFTHAQLMEYFTPSEIAWLCNRTLYQEDYQRAYHKKRLERKKDQRREAKLALLREPRGDTQDAVSTVKSLLAARKAKQLRQEREEQARLEQEARLPAPVPTEEEVERERKLNEAFAKRPE